MPDQANAIKRARWWVDFIKGDFEAAASHLAPDMVRIGVRDRDANNEIHGRDNYIAFLREVRPTQPRISESFVHDITASPDGRRAYLHVTEIDSAEPWSKEKIVPIQMVIINYINDDGLVSRVEALWRQPDIDYEWTGTAQD